MCKKSTFNELEIGDTILFKVATRSSFRATLRKVVGINRRNGWAMVRFEGYGDFVVKAHEINDVLKKEFKTVAAVCKVPQKWGSRRLECKIVDETATKYRVFITEETAIDLTGPEIVSYLIPKFSAVARRMV